MIRTHDNVADMPAAIAAVVAPTMTTREVAELTGKRHDHVMRDACAMLMELHGEEGVPRFEDTWVNGQNGQTYPMYRLPKRETLILISGYNLKMRARIIDRWQELEASATPIPQTLSEALRLAADLADAKANVESKLAIAAPKADALDRLADVDGLLLPTDAAKTLQISPARLFQFFTEHAWTYRRAGGQSHIAYQSRIKAGYLTHKVRVVRQADGSERVREQVLVTAKGLAKLASVFAEARQ